MELGEPRKVYTVEPIEDPIPRSRPDEPDDAPLEPRPQPITEPLAAP